MSAASQITWDDNSNPSPKIKWDATAAAKPSPSEPPPLIPPNATISPASTPSLWQRVKQWATDAPVYGGTLNAPGRSPLEKAEEVGKGAAFAAPVAMGVVNPIAALRSAIGATIGGAGGSWLGGYGGEAFGNRRLGERIGGTIGGLAGGIYGGLDKPIYGPWGRPYSIGKVLPSLAREEEIPPVLKGPSTPIRNSPYWNEMRQYYRMPRLGSVEEPGTSGSGRGIRPSETERTATNLVRKPILSPEEYAQEQRLLGNKASLKEGEGLRSREARLLGTVRARRAARGMKEPQ